MKKFAIALALIAMFSSTSSAGVLGNNTGCGVGTLLFESTGNGNGGWLLQTLAEWTNMTLSGTFSMTTGTVNCQGNINKVVGLDEVYEFVTANMDNLAKDAAMGSGESLNSLAAMLNVSDVDAFGATLQANFSEIFPNSDVESIAVVNKIIAINS